MSVEPHLVFLNSAMLGTPGSVERFVQAFQHADTECKSSVWAPLANESPRANGGISTEPVVAQAYAHRMLDFEASRLAEADRGIRFEVSVHLGWGEEHLGEEERTWVGTHLFQTALV